MAVLSDEQIAQYAYNAGFRGTDLAIAVAITHPESGGDPSTVQKGQSWATTGWGLWQITPGDASLLDPQKNADEAFRKYKAANGFSPWTTYVDGKYQQFLTAAQQATSKASSQTKSGSGLMKGKQTDPWGIGQGITDAVGYTGSVVGGIGRTFENTGTLLVGLLVIAGGLGILGFLFLNRTNTGQSIKSAGKNVAELAVAVPK